MYLTLLSIVRPGIEKVLCIQVRSENDNHPLKIHEFKNDIEYEFNEFENGGENR